MGDILYTGQENMSIETLIDRVVLKRMQDRFCEVGQVFAYCVDNHGRMLAEMSGSEAEIRRLYDSLGQDAFLRVCNRVTGNSLEDQVVEDTIFHNVKLAAINVKVHGQSVLSWVVCAVLKDKAESGAEVRAAKSLELPEDSDSEANEEHHRTEERQLTGILRQISEKDFYYVLDLMRMVTTRMVEAKYAVANIEAENVRSRSDQKEMSRALRRSEALTSIVQFLESDDSIELVFAKIIKIVGEYLEISSAQIFRINQDALTMDVIAEWCSQGIVSIFEKTRELPRSGLLMSEKTNVISFDTKCEKEERRLLEQGHIKAMAAIPLTINGQISMYAVFNECRQNRKWNVEDIRFINDAVQVVQSILVKRIQKNSLVSSYASLEAILDHVGCSICVRDQETNRILFVNKVLKASFDSELSDGSLDRIFRDGRTTISEEENYEVAYKDRARFYDLHTTIITWVDGRKAILYAAYDITEKKIYQKKIEQQAYTDFLTGLYNRMCCERDLAVQIDYAKKHKRKGALLYLDLDDFKHINDGLGHQYGDVLLKAIAHSVQRIEGIHDSCYRMGGDEFVIIISSDIYSRMRLITDEIKSIFAKPWFLKDADYYCTMSMGIVNFPDEGDSVQDLIKKADIAMYEAKRSGKNRIAQYTNKLTTASSNKRLDMEKNMRDATAQGYHEFEVYYQPITDIQLPGNPCTGAEALIRWNSPVMGFIPPSDFIPLAEYLGLINPIGNYVLQEACRTLKEWNDHGYPNYKINVNLSVVQLLQNDIVETIEHTIHESGVNPRNLTLEVTESLAINDMSRMKDILGRIKELGVRIALDDFGTGYSSLNHIREMPLDVIKVDQTFVRDLDKDTYSQSFIKMVSELAESIGVSVCVEGIEREEQLKVIGGMRVRMIQGYYFGRPEPKKEFNTHFAPKVLEV